MFIVTVELKIKDQYIADFAKRIAQQASTSVAREPDCHVFDVHKHESDPSRFFLYEVYADKAAFETHVQMPHSKESSEATKPWIESAQVTFWTKLVS